MTQWSITQWASLCSILIVAVSAIAICSRTFYIVKQLEEKVEKLDEACEAHRTNSDIHRNADHKNWLEQRFSGIERKLDQILISQESHNRRNAS